MNWRQILEQLQAASSEQLDSPAFISCEPTDRPAADGFRYMGVVDCLQELPGELQACFLGEPNQAEPPLRCMTDPAAGAPSTSKTRKKPQQKAAASGSNVAPKSGKGGE